MKRIHWLVLAGMSPFALTASASDIRVDGSFVSDAPSGTPPLQVASPTMVTNLNAEMLGGKSAGDFATLSGLSTAGSGVTVHWKNLVNLPAHEIDLDCALNTGCDTGADSAGYPVTITDAGSYRLASNLQTVDENTTLIQIQSSNVTLDLNGFRLQGPVSCSDTPVTGCTPSGGSGSGVEVTSALDRTGVTIRNGAVQGMGNVGIWCQGSCSILDVTVAQNGVQGINAFDHAIVDNVTAYRNGHYGILATGLVRNSYAFGNNQSGIVVVGSAIDCKADQNGVEGFEVTGTVANSTADLNTLAGFFLSDGSVATNNVATNNLMRGFLTQTSVTLRGNTAHNNTSEGFYVGGGSAIGNGSFSNTTDGFACNNCLLLDNVSADNDNGVTFTGSSSWGRNMLVGNTTDTSGSPADVGGNICDGSAC